MKRVLHHLSRIICIGMFGFSSFSAERAVYTITFDEGVLPITGNPFALDNRYLAKVTINVITNTASGLTQKTILTVRGSTIPDQFWFPSALASNQLASIGGFTNAIRSLQLSVLTNVTQVPTISELIKTVNGAYEKRWPLLAEGMYDFVADIPEVPSATQPAFLRLARDNWIPTLNDIVNPALQTSAPFAELMKISVGTENPSYFVSGPTIHPDDWVKFYSTLPNSTAWSQNYYAGSVVIFRRPLNAPRRLEPPANLRPAP